MKIVEVIENMLDEIEWRCSIIQLELNCLKAAIRKETEDEDTIKG